MNVLIVGVGLIGGSFALALREHGLAERIDGVEASEEHARRALERKLVDRIVTLEEGLAAADLIVPFYMIVGGDDSFDDAIAMLSQYEIVPADLKADDTLTIGDLAVYADNFCYAVQLPATEGEGGDAEAAIEFLAERDYLHMMPADSQLSAEAIATRAQVAYLLTAICMEP